MSASLSGTGDKRARARRRVIANEQKRATKADKRKRQRGNDKSSRAMRLALRKEDKDVQARRLVHEKLEFDLSSAEAQGIDWKGEGHEAITARMKKEQSDSRK